MCTSSRRSVCVLLSDACPHFAIWSLCATVSAKGEEEKVTCSTDPFLPLLSLLLFPRLSIRVHAGSKAGAAYVKAAEHYMQAEDSHDAARRFNDAATAYQKTDVERTSL